MNIGKKIGIGAAIAVGVVCTVVAIAYYREAKRPEPVHFRFSRNKFKSIKDALLRRGFRELGGFAEIKKHDQIWGVAKLLPDNLHELHIRAFTNLVRYGEIYLSAHVESRRDSPAHLLRNADNEQGKQLLMQILREDGFYDSF